MLANDIREKTIKKVKGLDIGLEYEKGSECAEGKDILYAVPQSDATVRICEGILKLKRAEVDRYICNRLSITLDSKSQNIISLDIDNTNRISSSLFVNLEISEILNNIRASQVQLFQYILYQYNQQGSIEVKIDVGEFFKIKDIKRRKENMDRFLQDVCILSFISLDMITSYKGQESREIGNLLKIKGVVYSGNSNIIMKKCENSKVKYIVIELGNWANNIKLRQFVYLQDNFFRYNSKSEWMAILLSVKFGQLVKTNREKLIRNGFWNCKISTIINYLGITEEDVIKQGHKYYYKIFNGVFKALQGEGYQIKLNQVDDYKTTEDFIKGSISYGNNILLSEYKTIKKR